MDSSLELSEGMHPHQVTWGSDVQNNKINDALSLFVIICYSMIGNIQNK